MKLYLRVGRAYNQWRSGFLCLLPKKINYPGFQNDEYQLVIGVPNTAVYSLHYEIVGDVIVSHHKGAGFDDKDKAVWLYDEFHKIENHYEHHIVFSDGMEIQVPFIFFFCRKQLWFEE